MENEVVKKSSYRKRTKYVVAPDGDLQIELMELLREKFPETSEFKIKQLALDPAPMSKMRWIKWLHPNEMEKFLVVYEED